MKRWIFLIVVMLMAPIAAQGTAIIVSDSDCDVAMAELLASVMEAEIIEVEWGTFDEKAIEEVLKSNPENIIIIGGSMAVVDKIQDTLEKMGFSIVRIAGKDRTETSLELYRSFKDYFSTDFAVVVVDTSRASIVRGKNLAIRYKVPLFFCDVSDLDYVLEEINTFGITEIRIITSNRQGDLRSMCEKKLQELKERVDKIEVTEENGEVVTQCKSLYLLAQEAFENGNYLLCLQYLTEIESLLLELEGSL